MYGRYGILRSNLWSGGLSTKHTNAKTPPINNISFISCGQLGLWVGISAITLCEIFGFLSLAIQNRCTSLCGVDDKDDEKKIPPDETKKEML